MTGFFLESGDFLYHKAWVLGGMTWCMGLVTLEAVIECSNRKETILRNRTREIHDC